MLNAEKNAYRSFLDQAFHYFNRNHTGVPAGHVASPADWRGVDMRDRPGEWLMELDAEEISELSAAADALIKEGLPLAGVTRENFPLPRLAQRVAAWRRDIATGRGFVVVRGLPLASWDENKASCVFWGLGHHLGVPGAQNASEELLGHVRDCGDSKETLVRQYRTTENIDFHCDAADVVGLLCLRDAREGGQSRIVSSVAVYNRLVTEHPDLVPRLFEPFALDRRDENAPGEAGWLPIQPCCYGDDGVLRTFYHSSYFRSAERHPDVDFDDITRKLLDSYDSICADPETHLDMWLKPGDMQFISNHTVVHARTGYTDWPEPDRKRHLLRLWLSIE